MKRTFVTTNVKNGFNAPERKGLAIPTLNFGQPEMKPVANCDCQDSKKERKPLGLPTMNFAAPK